MIMKLNDYLEKIRQSSVFRNIIPVNQGVIYPVFSIRNGVLCASFLAHRTEMIGDELKIYFPEFYMTFTYPEGVLVSFERLAFSSEFTPEQLNSFEIMHRPSAQEALRKKEELKAVLSLGDRILTEWDTLKIADISRYNSAYLKIVTEKQKEIFEKF